MNTEVVKGDLKVFIKTLTYAIVMTIGLYVFSQIILFFGLLYKGRLEYFTWNALGNEALTIGVVLSGTLITINTTIIIICLYYLIKRWFFSSEKSKETFKGCE